jgi:predicted house-cleaning noncanonical NTP pyrophosphatase (MazG superfamily)
MEAGKESIMSVITYNKLVRDRIPEIIEADNKTCITRVLDDAEYLQMIDAKLDEELAEYHKDQNIEELADILEVVYAAAKARGYTVDELEDVRLAKVAMRGGFDKKLLLIDVEVNE